MESTEDINSTILIQLSNLLHHMQRERGCAALYLDSAGQIFDTEYSEQCIHTDDEIRDFRSLIRQSTIKKTLKEAMRVRLEGISSKLETLTNTRKKLRLLNSRYTLAINSYTFGFNIPLIDAIIELAHAISSNNTMRASAFANFIQWKERVGLERALGSRGFYAGAFRNNEFTDRMVALLEEQKTYLNTFLALASSDQVCVIRQVLENEDWHAITNINELISGCESPNNIEQYSGEAWYQLMTRALEAIHISELSLINGLSKNNEQDTSKAPAPQDLKASLSAYKSFIQGMPLFQDIPELDLEKILAQAQIRTYERGHLLFLQGEHASRLYIILKGWVKIFNGIESGEEATLQMLSSGEALIESAVLLDSSTPASAQVVEDATLLSIPAPVIREFIKRNAEFAFGMLKNLSLRSQHLVRQIEQSRLKTAEERVGWFLLRLNLEQDDDTGKITLPYDKSLIASYLDMRPETFSRALKKFRASGFEVNEDHLIMPSARALCSFCDEATSQDCRHSTSTHCPNRVLSQLL